MTLCAIGIGSNVDPEIHVPAALAALERAFGPLRVSPAYRSAPVGMRGGDFVNLVVAGAAPGDVRDALDRLRAIETERGRDRTRPAWSPRTLDLDLLLWGEGTVRVDGRVLPRAEILRYAFLLRPLADVLGTLRHPATGKSYEALWRDRGSIGPPLARVELARARPPHRRGRGNARPR